MLGVEVLVQWSCTAAGAASQVLPEVIPFARRTGRCVRVSMGEDMRNQYVNAETETSDGTLSLTVSGIILSL